MRVTIKLVVAKCAENRENLQRPYMCDLRRVRRVRAPNILLVHWAFNNSIFFLYIKAFGAQNACKGLNQSRRWGKITGVFQGQCPRGRNNLRSCGVNI